MKSNSVESSVKLTRRALLAAALFGPVASTFGCAMFNKPKKLDPSLCSRAVSKTTAEAVKEIARVSELDETVQNESNGDKKSSKKPVVCFIGVLGNGAEDVSKAARAELEDAKGIRLIEKSAMTAALKESGIKGSEVYIPAQREKFVDALGEPFDYLLAGFVEDVEEHVDPDDEDSKTIPKTIFRLELVQLETNRKAEFTADL